MHKKFMGYSLVLSVLVLFICSFYFLSSHKAQAAINNQINFQGKLTNTNGTNITNGTYSIVFSIYTVASGGSSVWTETQGSVSVTDGIFRVSLGSVTALPGSVDFNSASLYLGITVGADPEMAPRVQFTAVPYAFNSDKLGGLASSGFVQLGSSTNQTDATSNPSIFINKTLAGNLLQLRASGVDILTLSSGGALSLAGSLTSGSGAVTLSGNAASSLTTSTGALTLTSAAATTWSTTAGNLTIQAGSGTVSLGSTTSLNSSGTLAISSGAATALTIDSGTTGALNLGTGANAKSITLGNSTVATTVTANVGAGTTAFSILGPSSANLFSVDTTNNRLNVGNQSADATGVLLVLDTKNTAGDPIGVNGGQYYNSSINKFRCFENNAWKDCSTTILRTAADVTNGTTAYANITGLTYPVAANTDYAFSCNLIFRSAATTTGFAFSVNGPAAPTYISYKTFYQTVANATASTNLGSERNDAAYDAMAALASTITANVNLNATINGTLSNGATAGTLAMRFRSEVAASNITVKKGSTCRVNQL